MAYIKAIVWKHNYGLHYLTSVFFPSDKPFLEWPDRDGLY